MSKEIGAYIDEIVAREGTPENWEQACLVVQEAALQLGVDRHRQYGAANISEFGQQGVIIRASDKLKRAWNMLTKGIVNQAESIEDSFGDLSNYGLYGVMLIRGWWDLPLVEMEAAI